MTDYYPLIAKAVAGLEKNTGEARRSLYERARNALVDQLRGLTPPLAESEITRERLALEEAIRKVEAEAARRPRQESQRPGPAAAKSGEGREGEKGAPDATPPPETLKTDDAPRREPPVAAPPPQGEPPQKSDRPVAGGRQDRAPSVETGLKGFRDVVAEAETLGGATAQAAKSARQVYAAVPSDTPELDRIEPRVESRDIRPAVREPAARPAKPASRGNGFSADSEESFRRVVEPRPDALPAADESPQPERRRRGFSISRGLVTALVAVLVVLALVGALYLQRDRLKSLLVRHPGAPAQQQPQAGQPPPQSQPKIGDRVGQAGSTAPGQAASGQPASQDQNVAPVAQRVVLYEEDPADPQGKRYVGSVIWKTDTVSPGPGQPPEIAVRGDLEIPERHLNMTISVRRNTDKALPASHTIEIMFNLPPDFPFGGISNVPGILMKQAEQTRGSPLAGLAVKVTAGFFLVGLSSAEADMQRNLELLKDRAWFDIPVVYGNGRRAILAVEKGTPGERAFNEAFAAWGQ
jgi:hypothetical protein